MSLTNEQIETIKSNLRYIIDAENHGKKYQQLTCDAEAAAWLLELVEKAR